MADRVNVEPTWEIFVMSIQVHRVMVAGAEFSKLAH